MLRNKESKRSVLLYVGMLVFGVPLALAVYSDIAAENYARLVILGLVMAGAALFCVCIQRSVDNL